MRPSSRLSPQMHEPTHGADQKAAVDRIAGPSSRRRRARHGRLSGSASRAAYLEGLSRGSCFEVCLSGLVPEATSRRAYCLTVQRRQPDDDEIVANSRSSRRQAYPRAAQALFQDGNAFGIVALLAISDRFLGEEIREAPAIAAAATYELVGKRGQFGAVVRVAFLRKCLRRGEGQKNNDDRQRSLHERHAPGGSCRQIAASEPIPA